MPEGDNRARDVCQACGKVFYQNPKVVAGCILHWQNKILLCRRSIEPRANYWTVPAGFMENHESIQEAAAREAWEEARAKSSNLALHGIYALKHVSQVYVLYHGSLDGGHAEQGNETHEVKLCEESEIPWDRMAFRVVTEGLKDFLADRKEQRFQLHQGELSRNAKNELLYAVTT